MTAGIIRTSLQRLTITFGWFFCCLPAAVTSGGAAKLTGWVAFSPQFPPSSLALVFNQPCPCRQNARAWWLVQSLKSPKDLKVSVGVTEEEEQGDLNYYPLLMREIHFAFELLMSHMSEQAEHLLRANLCSF